MEAETAHDEELHEHDHEHDRGLSHDLPTLLSRRRALAWLGGTGLAVALAGCGVTGSDGAADAAAAGTAGTTAGTTAGAAAGASGTVIPEETAGPYPGDGSNGVNVLRERGGRHDRHPQRPGVAGRPPSASHVPPRLVVPC